MSEKKVVDPYADKVGYRIKQLFERLWTPLWHVFWIGKALVDAFVRSGMFFTTKR